MTLANKESYLFTVVIPNFQRTKELSRALDSILNQEGYDKLVDKIIVVDDNSNNILEIDDLIRSYGDEKIHLIKNTFKSNAAQTRNQGARLAKTKWVCFLDSDDAFFKSKFIDLEKHITSGSDSDVYYNRAEVYFDGKVEDIVPHRKIFSGEHVGDYLFVENEYLQTSTLTIKRSFFDSFGFNESYKRHQDYDLCLTLFENSMKFEYINKVGTKIFWGQHERPDSKGESVDFSKYWLEENRRRLSDVAINNFLMKFVVIKASRNGLKVRSLQELLKISKKGIKPKQYIILAALILIPSSLQNALYLRFKRLKTKCRK